MTKNPKSQKQMMNILQSSELLKNMPQLSKFL